MNLNHFLLSAAKVCRFCDIGWLLCRMGLSICRMRQKTRRMGANKTKNPAQCERGSLFISAADQRTRELRS